MNLRFAAFRLVALVAGLGAALLLAELGLRLTGLAPPRGVATVDERTFRRIPGIFVPDQRVVLAPGTRFEHSVSIDSLGYRGRPVARAKPDDELRVLFAGDSFTWGHNVEDDETLPAQLEVQLQERCGSTRVINAGVSGFTILGEAAQVIRGLVLEPDLVVVMYYENDLPELAHVRMWDQLAVNRRAKSRFPLSLVYGLMRDSALWSLALQATRTQRMRWGVRAAGARPEPAGQPDPYLGREEYRERLLALAELLETRGVPFLFVAYPSPESAGSLEPADDLRWAIGTARQAGLPAVDLHAALRKEGTRVGDAYLLPDDYHPSPAGYRAAARHLATFIWAELALARCPGPSPAATGGP